MKWTWVKWFLFAYKLAEHLIICWPLPSLPIHHVHPYPISWPASSETHPHPAHHPHPFSRMSPIAVAAAASSSIDPRHQHDPVPEPLPSGLFIPADQVHIYDFVNNYADDGYYDYDDEDSFQEKVRKWRENQRPRGYNHPDHKYNNDHTNAWLNSKKPSTSNKDGKQLESSSSGLENVAKNPDSSSSKNNNNNNNNNNNDNHNNHNDDRPVEFDDDNVNNRSSKDGPPNERKELTSGEAKDIETLLGKSEIITGRSASSSTSSSTSLTAPKTLPVEVSRHTITSPNGDMTVVTEMVYKNPYKPTPLPAYSHPPYLPSSRDGLYQPTDDPRLLHHQPHPPPPPPPPPSPSLENFGLGRSIGPGTTTYIPPPPRSSRNRDLATTPWTNGLGRVLPTPPTPFISSTSPSRSSPSSSSSSSNSNKIATSSSNKRLNKQLDSNISKRNEISERSLSATAIAGIIIGSLVFVALLAGVALFIMYRRPTLPGTTRLPQRSTEWVEPQVNLSNNNVGNSGSTGVNACPPSDPLPVTSSHFTRTQRPINKTTVSNTLNRSIDGLLVVGDWTLVSPGSNYETLTKKGTLPRGS